MELKNWAMHYIKQRASAGKKPAEIKQDEQAIVCNYDDGSRTHYFTMENLSLEQIKANSEKRAVFVCECNEHNFKLLAENWDLFKTNKGLVFIFLNLQAGEKWIIKPYMHAKIADPKSLKQGLRTMYETCMGL